MSEGLDPKVWHEVIRATLSAWLCRHFQPCCCEPTSAHLRCHRHVEFLWRKRYKDDLVTQFVRAEPWLQKADRLHLRDMMVTSLIAKGFPVLLANTSSSKARVHFPDGTRHRVTGVALNIRRRDLGQGADSAGGAHVTWRLGQSVEGSSEQSEYAERLSAHYDSADRYSDSPTGTGLFEVDDGDVIDDDDDDQGAHDGDDLNEQDLLSAFSATLQDDSFFRRPPSILPRAAAAANAAAARRACASASAGGSSRGQLPAAIGGGGDSNLRGLPRMPRHADSGAFGGFAPDVDLLSDTSWLEDPPRLPPRFGSARDLDLLEDPPLVTVADRGDGASPILAYTVPEARRVLCPTAAAESTPGRGGTYREVLRDEKRKEDEQWRQQPQWQPQRQQWQRQRWQQPQQQHEKQQQQQEQQLLRPRLQVALTSKAAPPTCRPLPAGMTMALRDAPAAIGCLPPCVTTTKRASGASGALQLRAMMAASAASSTAAALSTAAIATAAAVAAAAAAAASTSGTGTTPTAACVTPSVAPSAATVAAVAAVTTLRATVIGPAPSAVIGAAPSAAGGAAPAISIESTSSLKATASTSDASLILGRVSAAGGDLKALSELSQFSQSRLLEQLKGLGISKLGERVAAVNMLRNVNMLRSGAPLPLPASSAWAARLSVASATPATESVGASVRLVNREEGGCEEGGRDEGSCKEGGCEEGGRAGGTSGDTMIVDPPTVACTETMPVLEDGDSESLPDVPNLGTDLGTDLGRIWSQPALSAQLSSVSLPDFLTLWPSPAAPGRPSAPVPPTSTAPVSMPGTARPLERKRMRELLIGEMDEGNEGTSADDALEGGSDECCRAGAAEPGSEGLPSISGRISGLPSISGRISGFDGLLPMSKWLQPVTDVKVPGSPLLLRPGSSKRRGLL
jgi:hypothetical protein